MKTAQLFYQTGIPEEYRLEAVDLFDEAFGKKLSVAIRSSQARKQLLTQGLVLDHAIAALSSQGLCGIAGFHSAKNSLTGAINYRRLITQLGFCKGTWAAAILSIYERKPEPCELVMDGIAVRADMRGKKVGSQLLANLQLYAQQHGYKRIRLDVIDTNFGAKKLYQHLGFEATNTENFPYLKHFLGFSSATTMILNLRRQASN